MPNRYAESTEVSSDRSLTEIRRTLQRYGADGFLYGEEGSRAMIGTRIGGRRVQFVIALPDRQEFRLTETGRARTASSMDTAYEQAVRQRYRALALIIKAKLEAVASGVATIEQEFLAYLVLPGGGTVGDEFTAEAVARMQANGEMPPLLPEPRRKAILLPEATC